TLDMEVFQGKRDPSINFYQVFLEAYDKPLRNGIGLYYTSDELVMYMVSLLDHLSLTRLGLTLGLADPITWGAYADARNIEKPAGVRDADFVVQILDPATGTGTFPLHLLGLIFETMTKQYEEEGLEDEKAAARWKTYVRESLLPRLNAF